MMSASLLFFVACLSIAASARGRDSYTPKNFVHSQQFTITSELVEKEPGVVDGSRQLQDGYNEDVDIDPFVENAQNIENLSLLHNRLSTPLNGTVEASGGVVLSVGNMRDDGRNVIISSLGLNIKTSEGPSPCRIKIYTKLNGTEDSYELALDSNEVKCMGQGIETLVPSSLFLNYYREVYLVENELSDRKLMDESFSDRDSKGHDTMSSDFEDHGEIEPRRREQTESGNLDTEQTELGFVSGEDSNPTSVESSPTSPPVALGETVEKYPLLIPPDSVLTIFIVVVPLPASDSDGDAPYVPPPAILSGEGSGVSKAFASDTSIMLYEGFSVGEITDTVLFAGGSQDETLKGNDATLFNGAVYYDVLNTDMSVSEYYDALQYSYLPGDQLHNMPGCDKIIDTGYVDTVGSYGIMFDVTSVVKQEAMEADFISRFKDVIIHGMDVYIRNLVNTSIEVYVRNDGIDHKYMSYANPTGQTLIAQNWELVAKGIIQGRGAGVGTPIPPEAWLKDVVIEHGRSVGFYVSVQDAPDLRYRSSKLEEGDIFVSDGILGVGAGRSWGEYPLRGDGSDVYFSPREFSGSLKYHAHEGICDSPAPSAAPSVSSAPTIPFSDRYGPLCQLNSSLTSTFKDGTGSYGNLFDILAKTDLTITGIDLNVDWNTGNSTQVMVYAKNGSWFGFQNERDAWPYLLANTTLFKPEGFHDQTIEGTLLIGEEAKKLSAVIPESSFTPLSIKMGETWGLYVCISNADLRYTLGSSIGNTFAANSELRILEGAGAADFPPFPLHSTVQYTFYAPRVFNGNLRYDYVSECPSQAPSGSGSLSLAEPTSLLTSVTYTFYVEHYPDKLNGAITEDIELAMREVINSFLQDGSSLLFFHAANDGLVIVSVSVNIISPTEIGYLCIPTPPNICTPISVAVEAWHLSSGSSEEVNYALLREVGEALIHVDGYTVEYVGERAVETNSEITLSGVPEREMEGYEAEFFESVVQDFLSEQVDNAGSGDSGLQILSVTVNGQEIIAESELGPKESARSLATRQLKNSNKVKMSVKGKYRPPPEIDFGQIVEDSINAEPDSIADKLATSPRPQGETYSDYFEEAQVIGAREIKEIEEPAITLIDIKPKNDSKKNHALNLAAMLLGAMIFLLSTVFFLRPKRRAIIFGTKSKDPSFHPLTQQVGASDQAGIDSSIRSGSSVKRARSKRSMRKLGSSLTGSFKGQRRGVGKEFDTMVQRRRKNGNLASSGTSFFSGSSVGDLDTSFNSAETRGTHYEGLSVRRDSNAMLAPPYPDDDPPHPNNGTQYEGLSVRRNSNEMLAPPYPDGDPQIIESQTLVTNNHLRNSNVIQNHHNNAIHQ